MFRFLKYVFVMNRLRHAKTALSVVIASLVLLVLFLFISSDITVYVAPEYTGIWLMSKWGITIALITMMSFGVRRIFILFTRPFGREQETIDRRKEALLAKEVLYTKSERIITKYKSGSQSFLHISKEK